MISHFSDKWVFESSFLIYSVSTWPVGQLSRDLRRWADAHQYFCHSIDQSVYYTWSSCDSVVGSWLWAANFLQMVFAEWGKQRGCGEYCRWGAVVPEHFPWLKRKLWIWGSPTCEYPGKSPGYPSRETLVSQGESQISPSGPRKGYKGTMQVSDVRTFPSHYHLPSSNMAQGMKIQRGREKERCRNGHICTFW